MKPKLFAAILGLALLAIAPAAAQAGESLLTAGPTTPFPQNKQNEPAVAIDPNNPSVVAAGANEEIDNLPCNGSDCSFTPGVGGSGVYFSSDGDPGVAFGPAPGSHGFSWDNGSRLYYSNLTANFATKRQDFTFKGQEGIAVSHTDDVAAAADNDQSAWSDPSIVSMQVQSSSTFSDKPSINVDNASSSPH